MSWLCKKKATGSQTERTQNVFEKDKIIESAKLSSARLSLAGEKCSRLYRFLYCLSNLLLFFAMLSLSRISVSNMGCDLAFRHKVRSKYYLALTEQAQ